MTDKDYNRILSAADEFAEQIAKNMPYKDMIAEVYRNGAILEYNHLCKWHKATEDNQRLASEYCVSSTTETSILGAIPQMEYGITKILASPLTKSISLGDIS